MMTFKVDIHTSSFGRLLMILLQIAFIALPVVLFFTFNDQSLVGKIFIISLSVVMLIMVLGICKYFFQPESILEIKEEQMIISTRKIWNPSKFSERIIDIRPFEYFTDTSKTGYLLFSGEPITSFRFGFYIPNKRYFDKKSEMEDYFKKIGLSYMDNKEAEKFFKETHKEMERKRKSGLNA